MWTHETITQELIRNNYIPDPETISACANLFDFNENVLIEGPPGAGKTQLAKVAAAILNAKLVHIECHAQMSRKELFRVDTQADCLFSAFASERDCVVLLDEIDKLDTEVALQLLRTLDEKTTSLFDGIPRRPNARLYFVMTSNGRRKFPPEMLDRMAYCKVTLPTPKKEFAALKAIFPESPEALIRDVVNCTCWMRLKKFSHPPSLRCAQKILHRALVHNVPRLTPNVLDVCRALMAKGPTDADMLRAKWEELLAFVRSGGNDAIFSQEFTYDKAA